MSLRSRITGHDDNDADNETDETTAGQASADTTGVQPTFTPAPEAAAVSRPAGPADTAQEPTLVEPGGLAGQPDNASWPDDTDRADYNDTSGYGDRPGHVEPDYPSSAPADAGTAAADSDADGDAGNGAAPVSTSPRYAGVTAYEPVPVEPAQTALAYESADTTALAATGSAAAGRHAAPAGGNGTDQSLFADNPELRSEWQRIQSEFVDDPQEAVADAADLVQRAGQALVATLQQRQSQMRSQWDRSQAGPDDPTSGDVTRTGGVDTEQLRQIMRRYRALFDQLSQPV